MYLSDNELLNRTVNDNPDLRLIIESDNENHPFDAKKQISICSVDLRLSDTYWMHNKNRIFRKTIDLGDEFVSQKTKDVFWTQRQMTQKSGGVLLNPGDSILGRTLEKIKLPNDCAGKIIARSGITRIFLNVELGDFINPGYEGYFPLQMINHSKHAIKIYPYISVCQLILIKLSQIPENKYGIDNYYMDDDGGPANWWNKKQILNIKSWNDNKISDMVDIIQNDTSNEYILEVLGRFKNFYERKNGTIHNDQILQEFESDEHKKSRFFMFWIKFLKILSIPIASSPFISTILLYAFEKRNLDMLFPLLKLGLIVLIFAILLLFVRSLIVNKLENKYFYKIGLIKDNKNNL